QECDHRLEALEALAGLGPQHLEDRLEQGRRIFAGALAWKVLDATLDDAHRVGLRGRPRIRKATRERFVQRDAKRKLIGTGVDGSAAHLLGGHVRGRSDARSDAGELGKGSTFTATEARRRLCAATRDDEGVLVTAELERAR